MTTCPKCGAESGDDWSQCQGSCPLPGTPHYNPGQQAFFPNDLIQLVEMPQDPDPIEPGSVGRVIFATWVVDRWQYVVNWTNGRSLNLVCPPDHAEKIG